MTARSLLALPFLLACGTPTTPEEAPRPATSEATHWRAMSRIADPDGNAIRQTMPHRDMGQPFGSDAAASPTMYTLSVLLTLDPAAQRAVVTERYDFGTAGSFDFDTTYTLVDTPSGMQLTLLQAQLRPPLGPNQPTLTALEQTGRCASEEQALTCTFDSSATIEGFDAPLDSRLQYVFAPTEPE